MTEKEEICKAITKIYEDWSYSHHAAYVDPDRFEEWEQKAEAERNELCRRIRNLKE